LPAGNCKISSCSPISGKPVAYLNSLMQLSFALNQDSFANVYHISNGSDWSVEVEAVPHPNPSPQVEKGNKNAHLNPLPQRGLR
jgi:hypothetical protein